MVMGLHTAYRCQKCGEVFFKNRQHPLDVLAPLSKALGLLACPKCGSKDVKEDKSIRT